MLRAPSPDALSGATIDDRYRLETLLGSGGSGAVYRGTDLRFNRSVAIKLLHGGRHKAGLASFESEALTASRVNHPNAVAIYDIGTWNDLPYLVMEEARGRSLAAILLDGPIGVARAATIAAQLLDALDEAHRCGVIHCDLSSDNLIIDESNARDLVKVIDFGLARLSEGDGPHRLVGTVEYMAPEVLKGSSITPAADLYAAGVLIYEMLVGRTPFAGAADGVVIDGHLNAVPTPPDEWVAECPKALGDLVAQALSKDPASRPSSAADLRLAILASVARPAAEPSPPAAEPTAPVPVSRELVGRSDERDRLVDFILHRSGTTYVVGGEGLGKRRVVLEAGKAARADARLIVAGAPSGVRCPPWAPILELLTTLLEVRRPTVADLTRAIAKLGLPDRDVPGIAELFGVGPSRELDRESLRAEAIASAKRVVQAVGRGLPKTAIAFTDFDLFDAPSRELALEIAANASEWGLAVLITQQARPSVAAVEVIELQPLDVSTTKQLLAKLLPDFNASAAVMAAGSPARVEQLAGWILDGQPLTDAPSTIVDLVSQRILGLGTTRRTLVQAVAAFGGRVQRWRLEAVVPPESIELVPALVNATDDDVWLHSNLVTQVALACTPADVRQRLHRSALQVLGDDAEPTVRARHAEMAEDYELAYSMFTKAGLDAFSRFDSRGAAHFYGRAAASARRLHRAGYPDAGRRFVAATIFAAEALVDAGQPQQAESFLDEAELFNPTKTQQAACLRARGLAWLAQGRAHEGRQQLERAIAAGLGAGDLELACDAYLELAESLVLANDSSAAAVELSQAIDVTTGGVGWNNARAPRRLWRVGYRLAELALDAGETEKARQVTSDALAHARRRDSANGQARLSALMARICEASGDFASALRYRANAIKGLRRLGDRRSTAEILLASATSNDNHDDAAIDFARTLAEEIGWTRVLQNHSDDDRDGD